MFGISVEVEDRGTSRVPSRNSRFNRFFSSPAGSEFIGHTNTNNYDTSNKHLEGPGHGDVARIAQDHANTIKTADNVSNGVDEQDSLQHHLSSPYTPLDEYLFANDESNTEVDAVTQLQREHDAYVEVLEATHVQEIQALKKQLDDANVAFQNSPKSQELQREVEQSLAAMRLEVEGRVRAEAAEERRKDKEAMEAHFKETMTNQMKTITQAIKDEAQVQMQAQLQSMKGQIEAQVRAELRTETEHKVRLALVQQMRPQVRAELEQALRLEIRTVYSQEIRKEVEATIVPEVEKRIAAEYKAKSARTQSAQKEQVEAELQAQLTASKKALEERVRRDAEATIARKVAKKVEGEVRVRVEKMRQEIRTECEAEAQKLVEASATQLKQERAEIARLRAVENVRRTREEAAHKEAEAEFHKKVAEFKRYMQEEESRLARMKAVVQWRDEHTRRPPSSLATFLNTSSPNPTNHIAPSSSPGPSNTITSAPKSSPSGLANSVSTPPTTSTPMVSTALPAITAPSASSNSPPSISPTSSSPPADSFNTQPPAKPPGTSNKPAGLAFDFTFDVKLIAAKLISDAREHTHDILKLQGEPPQRNSAELTNQLDSSPKPSTASSPIIPRSQHPTPVKPASPLPSTRSLSPARSQSPAPAPAGYTLGPISTEQRAQREFETQPPIVPPQGTLGARLRVLLPRLYQLWDECEVSHVHRLDFSAGLRSVDVAQAERRVAMEIARLRRLLPTIQKEMAMVTRREAIKARLAQGESQGGVLVPAEKAALLAELRRVTGAAQVAISAWEAANGLPFMYRGFPYLALMSGSTS